MGVVSRFVITRLMEDPDFAICPALRLVLLQFGTGVGLSVGVGVIVGVLVMVGVKDGVGLSVVVGLRVAVGVSDGVDEASGVSVAVAVAVFVAVVVDVLVDVMVLVGVLGDRSGVFVTSIEILRRIVRALIPSMGSGGVSEVERETKGTNLGTMGKKSP